MAVGNVGSVVVTCLDVAIVAWWGLRPPPREDVGCRKNRLLGCIECSCVLLQQPKHHPMAATAVCHGRVFPRQSAMNSYAKCSLCFYSRDVCGYLGRFLCSRKSRPEIRILRSGYCRLDILEDRSLRRTRNVLGVHGDYQRRVFPRLF